MKKIIILAIMLLHVSITQAAEFTEGKQFKKLDQPHSETPKITEFFSFYCPHCYAFEQVLEPVKEQLPKDAEFEKNHVSFMGGYMGVPMAKAYATMVALGVDEKMIPVMFEKIQKLRQDPKNHQQLRQIFLDHGVDANQFDMAFNSLDIEITQKKFDEKFKKFQLDGVPSVIVNNQYLITPDSSIKTLDDYLELVNYLLKK